MFATPTTLLVVPYLFAMLRKGNDGKPAHGVFEEDLGMNEVERPPTPESPTASAAIAGRHRTAQAGASGASRVPDAGSWARRDCCCWPAPWRIGVWRHHSLNAQVMATAEQRRDFRPERARRGGARERQHHVGELPGTTEAFAQANIYARASGYISKRNVDIGNQRQSRGSAGGDHRARTRSPDRAGGGHARANCRRRCSRRKPNATWPRSPGTATSRSSRRAGSPRNRATPID